MNRIEPERKSVNAPLRSLNEMPRVMSRQYANYSNEYTPFIPSDLFRRNRLYKGPVTDQRIGETNFQDTSTRLNMTAPFGRISLMASFGALHSLMAAHPYSDRFPWRVNLHSTKMDHKGTKACPERSRGSTKKTGGGWASEARYVTSPIVRSRIQNFSVPFS